MKTCSSYIHEYDCLDTFTEFMMEASRELEEIQNKFDATARQFELAMVFESSKEDDHVLLMEAENDSLLGKIGTVVTDLLKKIADFIRDITKAITGTHEEVKDEMQVVSELMRDHPEIAMEVAKGINKEWFTYHDVAKFENDVAGLVNMLKRAEIDHKTFAEKVSEKCKAFSNTAFPIVRGTVAAGGLISIPTILYKKCTEASKSMSAVKELVKTVEEIYHTNREVHNAGPTAAAINAMARVANLTAKECSDRQVTQSKFGQFLSKITKGKIDIKRSKQGQVKFAAKQVKNRAIHEARVERKKREEAERKAREESDDE